MRYFHTCPYCEVEAIVTAGQVGKKVTCHACDGTFTVPRKVRENPAPEEPAAESNTRNGSRARASNLPLGVLVGALVVGALGLGTVAVLAVTGAFDKRAPEETAKAQPEPNPRPAVKPEPKALPAPKPEPKPEPKFEPPAPKLNPPPRPNPRPDPFDPIEDLFPEDGPRPPLVDPNPNPPLDPPVRVRPGPKPPAREPAAKITFPVPAAVELKPAPLTELTAVVNLPGKVSDAVVGGGGRYWCLLLSDQKQVAVFDANQGKVTKYLPLAQGAACLAAGMNKLLVVYPDTEVVVRYDLGTFEKEVTAKLPFNGTVKQTCMGAASAGPMLVFYGKGTDALAAAPVTFLDIATLKELNVGNGGGGRAMTASFRDAMHYRASPDGRVYGAWATSHSPTGLNGIVVSEEGVKSYYEHDSVGSVVPSPDGYLLAGNGVYTPELKALGKKEWSAGVRVPAQQGDWYLSIAPTKGQDDFDFPNRNRPRAAGATVYRTTDARAIVSLGDIGIQLGSDAWTGADFTQDKRVLFSPAGNLIAWVGATNDKLHLRKFDLQGELDKSGVDYLFVSSRPPSAEPGKPYTYALAVKSKKGGVAVKLDAGPEGMKVTPEGVLTWTPPKDWAGGESVILTVSDKSGQEAFHTFTLSKAVPPPPKGDAPAVPPAPPVAVPDPKPAPANPPPAANANAGVVRPPANPAQFVPTKAADKAEVKLPGAADLTCFGGNGRYVVLRLPKVKQVAVFDVCEGKVAKYLPLSEEGALIAAGNEHLFVLAPTANVIQRWSLKTFEKEATVANPLAGAPRALLVGHATDGPVFVVGPNRALDGRTFKEVSFGKGANGRGMGDMAGHPQYPPNVRVSADGRVFAWWTSGLSPSGLSSMVVTDEGAKSHYEHTSVGAILPGPDGTLFTGGGLYSPELKRLGDTKFGGQPIPAAHGQMFLTVAGPDRWNNKTDTKVTVRLLGENRPLGELGELAGLDLPADPWAPGARAALGITERLFFVPHAGALVVLNGTADKLVVHKVDLEALLEKAGIDYLFVTSRPGAAKCGTVFVYKPEVRSKKGGVTFKLDSGPDGMKVAADGTLTWAVPANFAEASVSVILTVADKSGQETFHTFNLLVNP